MTNIEEICARQLRELRRKKGFTLEEFERLSEGEFKAVVLGSYERGARAISLVRLEKLAKIYEVPLEYFFKIKSTAELSENRLIFDLRRIRKLETLEENLEAVKRFLASVIRKRSDWNGEVISLRGGDAQLLALISDSEISELTQKLQLAGFLFASEVSGLRSP